MSSSIQKIIEAQQLLSWGNRVAARRHLTLALQDNPHDAQLWFWLAKTKLCRSATDDALVPDILNDDDEDDPMPLGSELSDIQAAEMIVQLRNFIATNDNAQRHIAALSNALDYIDETRMKAKKQKMITEFFHI